MSLDDLAVSRFQHTCQSSLDIIKQLINDIIVADFDIFFLCQALGCPISFDIEADNNGLGSSRQVYIGLVDVTDTFVNQANLHILIANFTERVFNGFG